MIHVLTVHWKDDRWVDIQRAYLEKHIPAPFQVYAFLNDLPRDHREKFFYSSTEKIALHPIKLNLLADMAALRSSNPEDWLLFLDGDAFPVNNVVAYGEEKLKKHPLVAVQRPENFGDIQPHPSFCLTTIRFWKAIGGDWHRGHPWSNPDGARVTDVGGNLLAILNAKRVDWLAMRRTNKRNLHPVWFGLYDDVAYHHGAGFRAPACRLDWSAYQFRWAPLCPAAIRGLFRKLNVRFGPMRKILRRNRALSEQVYQWIARDPLFYRYFQEPPTESVASGVGPDVSAVCAAAGRRAVQ